jgi:hypothetical protein
MDTRSSRKHHPVKHGSGSASVGGPVDQVRLDEIVDVIVSDLKPHSRKKEDVRALVRGLVELLRKEAVQLKRRLAGAPAGTLKHAQAIGKAAAELERLLLTIPSRIAWVGDIRKGTLSSLDEVGLLDPFPHTDESKWKYPNFISDLGRLQTAAKIAESYVGPAPQFESDKHLCAKYAQALIVAASKTRLFEQLLRIAPLLYEALTGKAGASLERHCKNIRRLHKTSSGQTSAS